MPELKKFILSHIWWYFVGSPLTVLNRPCCTDNQTQNPVCQYAVQLFELSPILHKTRINKVKNNLCH